MSNRANSSQVQSPPSIIFKFKAMFKEIVLVLACVILVSARPRRAPAEAEDNESPTPYAYRYDVQEANYTISRQEEMNQQGVVTGTYSYLDKDGNTRTVRYTADHNGFRAEVDSNEPGLISSAPADVTYNIK